jgi:selenide,water dikinase
LAFPSDDNVLIGLDRADDAGVYRISDDLALIQTVDFFTPVVNDPYWFGQIAAANALSDVYAMGGIPKTALNLVAFPAKTMELAVLRQIIQGGVDKLKEAGVVLIGGHSIEDMEIKYGLSVTGFIHPERVLAKKNLRPGDRLVLTKALGTGIVNTAIKADMVSEPLSQEVTHLMAALNKDAARIMADFDVSACTDVTGFGLLGHLAEMVMGSNCSARIDSEKVPVIAKALEFANMGFIPAGAYKNRGFREQMIVFAENVPRTLQDLLFDPQTSGGLLISVSDVHSGELVSAMRGGGIADATLIGDIIEGPEEKIWIS